MATLIAWYRGTPVASFTEVSGGLAFEYLDTSNFVLSLSMPRGVDVGLRVPGNWLKNLLPENKDMLRNLADRLGVAKGLVPLISAIGEDVAGAVSILPEGVEPGISDLGSPVSWDDVGNEIVRARGFSGSYKTQFGDRMSLAGMQEKFSLHIPVDGGLMYKSSFSYPSTHIFKPGRTDYRYIEEAEAATLELARLVGVESAHASVVQTPGGTSFVTRRFDRVSTDYGIQRLHMEDLSQTIGYGAKSKYDPTLKGILDTLRDWGISDSGLYTLVSQMVFNVHVGNSDGHSKNYSILLDSDDLRPTPLYDSIPIAAYPFKEQSIAMHINGVSRAEQITRQDWVSWAERHLLDPWRVDAMVVDLVTRIRETVPGVYQKWGLPDYFRDSVLNSSSNIR